ncbi:nucleolar protein 9 [Stegostoma tigrinum]|uniref:nucleolar protein 9 n=1 Tax=Stegostoma tigrinum TaxID=3053191 RepID=UPI00286FE391|nr:nucleolar protein 9 [Stegostoma tigrinum]
MGIVTELVAGCVKHRERQGDILTKLYGAFHCDEPASRQLACAPLFISVLTFEVFYGLGEADLTTEFQPSEDQRLKSVNYHGSLVAQHLLRFEQPAPVLRSLAAMPPGDCVRLACDQVGSHVLDAVFTSSTVTDKQRKRIVRRFTGQFALLACDRHGSRVLDQIWSTASVQTKRIIAEELAAREDDLSRHPVGHHVARNLALGHFLKHRRTWEAHQEAGSKRQRIFAELLED